MSKFIITLFLFLVIQSCLFAQAPLIQWQRALGGSGIDRATAAKVTSDGGYVMTGYTRSNDGDVSGLKGSQDAWVAKLNNLGSIQWQRCLGGSGNEFFNSVQITPDGGYILAGTTQSNDGDVSGNRGETDFWIVKLDNSGNIQWQRCLGGSYYDSGTSIQNTPDGGYIVTGQTYSDDGDVVGYHGEYDSWVVKLSSTGGIQWQRSLGGSASEYPYSVQPTSDGGYIVAGWTSSTNGDVVGKHGGTDFWVVKLTGLGIIQWQRCLGGDNTDIAICVQLTPDGGYIVSGFTNSNDGDVSGNHGQSDLWIVKINSTGNIQWQRCLGGTSTESGYPFIQNTPDGGYIVSTSSSSNNGDVSGNHGGGDSWIVKLNNNGAIQWQQCYGGSSGDTSFYIEPTLDGGYFFLATTTSNNGDVSGNHGSEDLWAVKLAPATTPLCTSVRSGDWMDASTWSCGHSPTTSDAVVISGDHIITISTVTARAKAVKYNGGRIIFSTSQAKLSF